MNLSIMFKKKILIFLSLIFLVSCQNNKVIQTHGIAYLDKREKLITVNKTNKNDVIAILGKPATRGMTNENLWIYIERTKTKGKLLKLGKNYLTKNNVLVVEFNKYGIVRSKKFYDIDNMKKIEFAKTITENEVKKTNFIYSFLSSIRQKMETSKK